MKSKTTLLCKIAEVSKSGYYKWLKTSEQQEKDYPDYLAINEVFEKGKKKLGSRTIVMKLKEKDIEMCRKKVSRIMRKYQLYCKIRKANPYKLMLKKTAEHRIFPNILNRNFNQLIPFKAFCTDITYIRFEKRFVYLSVVKDVASGEAVSWHLSQSLEMSIVVRTIEKLQDTIESDLLNGALIHSDQGFHYTSPIYSDMIKELGMAQSMSRKGNCIDNAKIETFFGHFKDEIDYKNCKTFEELGAVIDEYMKNYNTTRRQWELKKMTPVEYRNHLLIAA